MNNLLTSAMKIWLKRFSSRTCVFLLLLVVIILTNLAILCYLLHSQSPSQKHILPYYILGPDGQGLFEVDGHPLTDHKRQACPEKHNFVFIKGIKCATTTLHSIFYRFGFTRNLSFVSPLGNQIYLNWPFPMTKKDFRHSSSGFNILADHAIYTEDTMSAIMPNDTVYISIIREPLAQLKSTFQYYKLAKIAGVPARVSNPVVEYFSHLDKYESAYKAHGAAERWCIPDSFSMTKNIMAHCHGMPLGFPVGTEDISGNSTAVRQYIQHLDSKFSLVMIVEYFYESLILLRRLMCWDFKDIIFINMNLAEYSFKNAPVPSNILDLHRNWSSIDYQLYDYFNSTFWYRVSKQGSDFVSEVKAFKHVEETVESYCKQLYKTYQRDEHPANMRGVTLPATSWSKEFSVTAADCWMLGPESYFLKTVVQKEMDTKEKNTLSQKQESDNRTFKGLC